ncbi:holin-associated N-acetylmuramidase [Rhodovulum adriaticum]|uniref:Putative peptidoglycan binding protein n=1 Tax=Rhodovulum adriaticum TaxID=35804 RepID=A0A4R2NUU5_RHOAD|nr:holin-associated N-acetylmuramidase [Rhodovulum adriaticum]MBK1635035.1 peptidoglycan-binding protein [Rhodovulum adriaticum]TCP25331.1 putative peptidoglycan binding protein [Rhodovulum adriaticum]
MQTVQELARAIVAREGGFVNDPDDPGGLTKHGVTLATLRGLGIDLDGDGQVDLLDLRKLDQDRAVDIFVQHYYAAPRLDQLPEALQPSVFDMYVHSGANAVRLLQRLLNDMGAALVVDGVIGPQTAQTARAAVTEAPEHIADAYGIARRNYYYALADRRPASRKYVRRRDGGKGGWIKRAETFIAPGYHLGEDAHRARVAAWD